MAGWLLSTTSALLLTAPSLLAAGSEIAGCERALDQWTVRHFGTEEGLPLETVYALAGDHHGFIWVGTEDGLARFDGHSFERIDLRSVLGTAPEFTRALASNGAGRLYAGISSSGVVTIDVDTARPMELPLPLRSSIEALQIDGQRLLVGSRGEPLLALQPGEGAWDRIGDREAPVRAITPRAAGGFWIGHDGQGVEILEGDQLRPAPFDDLPNPFVSDLLEDRQGTLWIGTREGLFSWNGSKLVHHAGDAGLVESEHIVSLYLDDEGHLWAGTGGDGVARLCRGRTRFERLGEDGELGRGHVNQMLEDRDGGLWLASGGDGLFQLLRGAAVPIGPDQGLPPYPVLPVTQDGSGRMWLGTFGGGVARLDGERVRVFSEENSDLKGNRVLSLAPDGDGVWVGTRVGLNRIAGDEVSQPVDTGLTTISALLVETGQLWIGSVEGLFLARNGRVDPIDVESGALAGHVLMLRRDSAGRLWVSTDGDGLHYLDGDGGALKPAPFREGLPSSMVYDMLEQPDGTLWFATSRGLVRVNDEGLSIVGSSHGLEENAAFSILQDGDGHVWLSGNRGVFRVPGEQLDAAADGRLKRLDVMHFDHRSGMPRGETNGGFQYAAWRDRSGRLWYPTVDGAAVFDPDRLAAGLAKLTVRLTAAATDQGAIATGATLDVPAGAEWLRLNYTAPYFRHADEVEFRYRLAGFEQDWFVTRERSAVYRRLPPGRHDFQVQARTTGGEWSPSTRHAVQVARFWYQNPLVWGLSIAALAGMLATALYYVARRRQHRRERMAQAQKLEAVGRLAGGIAHDFNNVLTAIMSGTEIVSDYLPAHSPGRKETSRILDATERAAGLTRQLLTFAGRQQVEPQWVALDRELDATHEFIQRLLSSDTELIWDRDRGLGYCYIDRVQLQQVLMNLVVNARDAMEGKGRIVLRAKLADAQAIARAGLSSAKGYVIIEISDSGPGLERGTEHRIFEPFFTTKSRGRGTGLGLAVVYGIVDSAGGWIGVRSKPGQGATFTFLLPVEPEVPGGEGQG